MSTEVDNDQDSGTKFREKFEATQAANSTLMDLYAKTFEHVKAEDLKDVDPSQMASKAQEIEAARKTELEATVRKFLNDRGVAGDDLEGVLSSLGQHPASQPDATVDEGVQARIAALGQLGGTAPQSNAIPQGVYGEDRIRAAVAASKAMT